jgi:transcriptional regulator with XRE-family HTH domain
MNDLSKQIRAARKAKGWTQTDLAKKIGVPMTTLATWEQGKAQPRFPAMVMLVKTLDIKIDLPDDSYEQLLEAIGEPVVHEGSTDWDGAPSEKRMVPVVGYVGAGGEIEPIDDHGMGAGMDETDVPPNAAPGTVAVKVRGDSMIPMLYEGMIVFYSLRLSNISDHLHKPIVVHFADGRKAIKTVITGSQKGVYTLTSFNASPIPDIKIESVSPIDWIKPI